MTDYQFVMTWKTYIVGLAGVVLLVGFCFIPIGLIVWSSRVIYLTFCYHDKRQNKSNILVGLISVVIACLMSWFICLNFIFTLAPQNFLNYLALGDQPRYYGYYLFEKETIFSYFYLITMSCILMLIYCAVIAVNLLMRPFNNKMTKLDLSIHYGLLLLVPIINIILHLFGNFHYFFYHQVGVNSQYSFALTWETYLAGVSGLILFLGSLFLALVVLSICLLLLSLVMDINWMRIYHDSKIINNSV